MFTVTTCNFNVRWQLCMPGFNKFIDIFCFYMIYKTHNYLSGGYCQNCVLCHLGCFSKIAQFMSFVLAVKKEY